MRKFIVSVVVALVVLCGAGFYVYKTGNVSKTYENKETKEVNNNMLSMMLETSAGSGEYQQTTASAWPTDGYIFNENLSKCEKGSSLSWDSSKNTVVMIGNVSDRCYVYFDMYVPPRYDEICDESLLACHVAKQYTETQGDNNMYYHDSTLVNGAKDKSYRYAGSSDTTNNLVCFGYDSTDGTCQTDYLYRIIGVFANQVKLIKYDYANSNLLGTDGEYSKYSISKADYSTYKGTLTTINAYFWNDSNGYSSKNTWSDSELNTINLNLNYLNNLGTAWSDKIATYTWKVGGYSSPFLTVPNTYINEIISPSEDTTYDAKIGLMYVSDYGYAASPNSWTKKLYDSDGGDYSDSSVTSNNWMYMGLSEWTISRYPGISFGAFYIFSSGKAYEGNIFNSKSIRPTFYLNSNVTYLSGSGTISSPILIK